MKNLNYQFIQESKAVRPVAANALIEGDCLKVMANIADASIDCVICDLPYGITACHWDIPLPLEELWAHYKRIIKPRGAIVLFGSQPFTSKLVMSNLEWFKYEWIWEKTTATGFVHSKNKPLRNHENILVFSPGTTVHASQSKSRMNYKPQMMAGEKYMKIQKSANSGGILHKRSKANEKFIGTRSSSNGERFPLSVVKFSSGNHGLDHTTQKPINLIEYLVRTYTDEGDVILDNCAGSGSTLVAAENLNRRWIGIEKESEYVKVCQRRLERETRQGALFI